MSQWIFIEPNDVWMFRDNKPFGAAENFVAQSIFPPTPQTVQGAVRTHYLASQGVNFAEFKRGIVADHVREIVGVPSKEPGQGEFGSLQVRGPYVARYIKDEHDTRTDQLERLYPLPLDVMYCSPKEATADKKAVTEALTVLAPGKSDVITNSPFEGWQPLVGGGAGFKEHSGWLTQAGFDQYLQGKEPALTDMLENSDVFAIEERVGLAMDHKRRANREGHFYHARFVRMCEGTGLLVHVNEPIFADRGEITIGGEARTGRYQQVVVKDSVTATKEQIKVVLLTSAWFEDIYNTDWSPWVGGGRLVSVVVGKPQPISGWDVANNRPKPLRNFVPMGSVFYFEQAQWQGKPFTQVPQQELDFGAMGFGTCAVGQW